MGKNKKKNGAAAAAELSEDALLEQAIAENKAAVAEGRPLTQQEMIKKLDSALLLYITATKPGGETQMVPTADGELRWFGEISDAKAALGELQAAMPQVPGYSLGLNFTPLGRAFSLVDGWVKLESGQKTPPMRLQPSSMMLEAIGEGGLKSLDSQMPLALKKRNRRQTIFPLFFLEQLQSDDVLPYFFTRDDLVQCWVSSGKKLEDLPPQLGVVDLRYLVNLALTTPAKWIERLTIVPPQCMVDLMAHVDGLSDNLEAIGKLAAAATGEVIAEERAAHAAAVAAGDEPPALK